MSHVTPHFDGSDYRPDEEGHARRDMQLALEAYRSNIDSLMQVYGISEEEARRVLQEQHDYKRELANSLDSKHSQLIDKYRGSSR